MNEKPPTKPTTAQKLWDAFQACAEDNRVRPDRSPFYVRWAQAFVDFLPGKRLRHRSRQDIADFISDLGKRPGIEDWQVRQAEQALKLLYEVFLPGYAPESEKESATEKVLAKENSYSQSLISGFSTPSQRRNPDTLLKCLS